MLGIGPVELTIVLVIVLIIFGAGKLPQIGDALGRGIKNFKRATEDKDEPNAIEPNKQKTLPPEKTSL